MLKITADAPGQLNVLLHDGDSHGMYGTHVGVLEESNEERLCCFLQSQQCLGLEPEGRVNTVHDAPHEPLEGKPREEGPGVGLILLDLPESDSAWLEAPPHAPHLRLAVLLPEFSCPALGLDCPLLSDRLGFPLSRVVRDESLSPSGLLVLPCLGLCNDH